MSTEQSSISPTILLCTDFCFVLIYGVLSHQVALSERLHNLMTEIRRGSSNESNFLFANQSYITLLLSSALFTAYLTVNVHLSSRVLIKPYSVNSVLSEHSDTQVCCCLWFSKLMSITRLVYKDPSGGQTEVNENGAYLYFNVFPAGNCGFDKQLTSILN